MNENILNYVNQKELGVKSASQGYPVIIENDIKIEQVQNLVRIIQAKNGNFNWQPRCGFGQSY
jgi:hypothetical protein